MLTNKIQKYIIKDLIKNLTIILITFTSIAWAVRAVNFLDLIIEDGFNAYIYLKYSLLNITAILTKFIPLSFLIALFLTIIKLEKQQELLILWVSGLNKIKVANIFIVTSIIITIIQITITFYLNPILLSKSRQLLRLNEEKEISSLLRSNNFNDNFKGVTFFIEKKNENNELINIFIQDDNKSLNLNLNYFDKSNQTTILASKGIIKNNKLLLYEGSIQIKDKNSEIKNIYFEETELNLLNFKTRTITEFKTQEISSLELIGCLFSLEIMKHKEINCFHNPKDSIEHIFRRVIKPFYLILIACLTSFLLIYKKEKNYLFLKKYIIFIVSFLMLVFSEILLRYSGLSKINSFIYALLPFLIFVILYTFLIFNLSEKKFDNE